MQVAPDSPIERRKVEAPAEYHLEWDGDIQPCIALYLLDRYLDQTWDPRRDVEADSSAVDPADALYSNNHISHHTTIITTTVLGFCSTHSFTNK